MMLVLLPAFVKPCGTRSIARVPSEALTQCLIRIWGNWIKQAEQNERSSVACIGPSNACEVGTGVTTANRIVMARWPSWVGPTAAGVTVLLVCALNSHTEFRLPPNDAATSVSITVDLDNGHSVAPTLYGIFFEEVRSAQRGSVKTLYRAHGKLVPIAAHAH